MSEHSAIGLGFGAYLVVIFALGFAAYRNTSSTAGFFLGDRRLSAWVTALSAGASDMSGWLLLGLPGLAYSARFEAIWVALGLFIGTYLNWRLIARRLREQTANLGNALTIPEFLERRFDDDSHLLKLLSAFCILTFFVFYTASGFVAGAKLFEAAFGVPYTWAVWIGALLVLAYTSFGGFIAVAWTDALQALLMLAALVFVAIMSLQYGADGAPSPPAYGAFIVPSDQAALSGLTIASSLAWGLGYAGQPHILARFMAIRDPRRVDRARRLGTAWSGIVLVAALAVGVGGQYLIAPGTTLADPEKILFYAIETLLHPAVAGICLCAILAAIMSTADSQLLVAAAALTHDLMPGRDATKTLKRHRLAVVFICLVAIGLALEPDAAVLDMVAYAWAGFGATIGPAIIASLYFPRARRHSVLIGILVGALTVIIWEQFDDGIFALYSLLPGFIFNFVAIIITNWFYARSELIRQRAR